jgi:hypothetical protein
MSAAGRLGNGSFPEAAWNLHPHLRTRKLLADRIENQFRPDSKVW